MKRFKIFLHLANIFFKNPIFFLKALNWYNIRRFFFALNNENDELIKKNIYSYFTPVSKSLYTSTNASKIDDNKTEEISETNINHEVEILKEHFDKEYYNSNYFDEGKFDTNPLKHYCEIGWKKGFDPSPNFSTSFYINNNPDVAVAKINPFFHFLVAGVEEGRLPVEPASYEKGILKSTVSLEQKVLDWKIPKVPNESDKNYILENLSNTLKKNTVFSISHDNYIKNVGGIQLCILREQIEFNTKGYNYIHFSPIQPLPRISYDPNYLVRLLINGENEMIVETKNLLNIINSIKASGNNYLILHSLLGHNLESIAEIFKSISLKESYFWTHDYLSLCSNFNLLRNDINYCHAPDISSNGCDICTYKESRIVNNKAFINLFQSLSFNIIAPSENTASIWKEKNKLLEYKTIQALPHCWLKEDNHKLNNLDTQINVAFLGYPVHPKGWTTFLRLYNKYSLNKNINFYHLSSSKVKLPRLKNVPVSFTDDNESKMKQKLIENNIHVAIISSQWPETFCFTAYEAMAAGCFLICNKESGNVVNLINSEDCGMVLKNDEEIINLFNSDKLKELKTLISNKRKQGTLLYSKMTADLI